MLYQHATGDRDKSIADALNLMIEEARRLAGEPPAGGAEPSSAA
jgi:hypothetical protein